MNKRLETWQIIQRFADVRSGIVLSFLVANVTIMAWIAYFQHKDIPTNYLTFLGIVWAARTTHGITKTMKGQDNE